MSIVKHIAGLKSVAVQVESTKKSAYLDALAQIIALEAAGLATDDVYRAAGNAAVAVARETGDAEMAMTAAVHYLTMGNPWTALRLCDEFAHLHPRIAIIAEVAREAVAKADRAFALVGPRGSMSVVTDTWELPKDSVGCAS